MHQYIMLDHLDAEFLVRERLGLGIGQGSSQDSQKLRSLAQKYVKEIHEDAEEPLPTCPGPQQWSSVVCLSHTHKAH